MHTEPTHGGARRNAGRKLEVHGEKALKLTVTLDSMSRRRLVVVGDGNLSLGIRRAAVIAYDKLQKL